MNTQHSQTLGAHSTVGTHLLDARKVHRTYTLGRVQVPVLKGASLTVKPGEWVAVLGSSGSGKSTLLHLLGGLDRPDQGTVEFQGQSIDRYSPREMDRYRNDRIGFVFQFYHLLPELTVVENTMLPAMIGLGPLQWFSQREEVRRHARILLDRFGLAHRFRHRPAELSGGERQRVAIARALMRKPSVLLADEPSGNLDAVTGQQILDKIAELHREGLSIVMVTHDQWIAARADRVVHLADGRVVESAGE